MVKMKIYHSTLLTSTITCTTFSTSENINKSKTLYMAFTKKEMGFAIHDVVEIAFHRQNHHVILETKLRIK